MIKTDEARVKFKKKKTKGNLSEKYCKKFIGNFLAEISFSN